MITVYLMDLGSQRFNAISSNQYVCNVHTGKRQWPRFTVYSTAFGWINDLKPPRVIPVKGMYAGGSQIFFSIRPPRQILVVVACFLARSPWTSHARDLVLYSYNLHPVNLNRTNCFLFVSHLSSLADHHRGSRSPPHPGLLGPLTQVFRLPPAPPPVKGNCCLKALAAIVIPFAMDKRLSNYSSYRFQQKLLPLTLIVHALLTTDCEVLSTSCYLST